jgi:membrane protein required for colicin V production
MPVSWLDVILVTIMLISGFLAMVRGFTREVLSVFSWAAAAVAALYLTPKYYTLLLPYIDKPTVAQIAFGIGVFIICLIIISLITWKISDVVLDSRVGALDRTLGFLFGLARGFLLVAIVFILFNALARDQPEWVRNAKSFPILQQTQVAIESLVPMDLDKYLPGGAKPEGAETGAPGEASPGAAVPEAAPGAPPSQNPPPEAESPAPAPAPAPAEGTETQR